MLVSSAAKHPLEAFFERQRSTRIIEEWDAVHWDCYDDDVGKYTDDLGFYRLMIEQRQPRKVLDCGCGTGRITSQLLPPEGAGPSYQVLAIDASRVALERLSWRLGRIGRRKAVSIMRGDYRALPIMCEGVDLIIFGFDNVGYLPDRASLMACLAGFRRALSPNGAVIIDFRAPRHVPIQLDRAVCVARRVAGQGVQGTACIFEFTTPCRSPWIVRKRYAFEVPGERGACLTVPVTQRFWTAKQVRSSLVAAGYKVEWKRHAYGRRRPKGLRWNWIQIVARKSQPLGE